jgi:hypothetical protein
VRVLIATAGLLVLAGAAAAATSQPQTMRRSPGPVDAITQDGRAVAWLATGGSKCNVVHVLDPGGEQTMPQPSSGSMTCRWRLSPGRSHLAYAAGISSALWTLHQSSPRVDFVLSARAHGAEQHIDQLQHASDGTGWWLGGIAGAGTTLAYSKVDVEYVDKLGCLSGGSCKKKIAGGGIYTVSGGQATLLPSSPPALELAAAGNLIAYVEARAVAKSGAPAPVHTGSIFVVDSQTGTIVSQSRPLGGLPIAVALAPQVLVALTRGYDGHGDRVTWYDPGSGHRLGSVPVPRTTATELTASDRMIVYRVGHALRGIALDLNDPSRPGRRGVLARPDAKPVGLSLLRNRLVWAENTAKDARIRELFVR